MALNMMTNGLFSCNLNNNGNNAFLQNDFSSFVSALDAVCNNKNDEIKSNNTKWQNSNQIHTSVKLNQLSQDNFLNTMPTLSSNLMDDFNNDSDQPLDLSTKSNCNNLLNKKLSINSTTSIEELFNRSDPLNKFSNNLNLKDSINLFKQNDKNTYVFFIFK